MSDPIKKAYEIASIQNDINEHQQIINKYISTGHLDREEAISRIQKLRLNDENVMAVTDVQLAKSSVPFSYATDDSIVGELKMQVEIAGNGYETWSPTLRKRIIKVLGGIDVYEGTPSAYLLPDHKFSEIRWDENTKADNPDNMTDEEIKAKFQLLTNQRNQQKREVCRNCFQTGKRGTIYGISYFYEGNENWDSSIPIKGREAENGCVGCPWYDIQKWKDNIIRILNNK